VLFNSAVTRIPVGAAVMGLYIYPVVVAVLAAALTRERLNPLARVALVLGIGGVGISLGVSSESVTFVGGALAVCSGIAWAITVLVIERMTIVVSPITYSAVVLAGMSGSLGLAGVVTDSISMPDSASAWACVCLSGVAMAVGVSAFTGSVAHIGSTKASIGNTVEPPATGVIASVLLAEPLTAQLVVGSALVTTALAMLHLDNRRPIRPG
jgi:drug/metabolite transporter (DMT)-like permease